MNSFREWRKDLPAPVTSPRCRAYTIATVRTAKTTRVRRSQRLGDRRVINDVEATVSYLQAPQRRRWQTHRRHRLLHGRPDRLSAGGDQSGVQSGCNVLSGQHRPCLGPRHSDHPSSARAEIHCPLQGHFGDDDKNPSPDDRRKLDGELAKHGKTHEFYAYAGAGHAFMDNTKESFRADAEAAAWPRALEFLRRHLGGVRGI